MLSCQFIDILFKKLGTLPFLHSIKEMVNVQIGNTDTLKRQNFLESDYE